MNNKKEIIFLEWIIDFSHPEWMALDNNKNKIE